MEQFRNQPVRQWVLSFPYPLRFLFASRRAIMGPVLGIVYRVIAGHLMQISPECSIMEKQFLITKAAKRGDFSAEVFR